MVCGDDGDREAVVRGHGHDREADAVDGDRALLDQVAQDAVGGPRSEVGRRRRRSARRRRRGPGPGGRPSRSVERTGRSRLTGSPGSRAPRLVRASVSATASAAHHPAPRSTTVRQQPLTAMESPTGLPSVTTAAVEDETGSRRRPAGRRRRPISSTIPVNIDGSRYGSRVACLEPAHRSARRRPRRPDLDDPAPPDVGHGRPRPGPANSGRPSSPPSRAGRQIEHVLVDQAAPGGSARPRAAPPSTRSWTTPAAPEVVEQRARGRRHLDERRLDPGAVGGLGRARPAAGPGPATSPDRQGRVVGPDRAGPDQDGVALGPQLVGVGAGQPAR